MLPIPEYPEYLVSPYGEVYSRKVDRYLEIQTNTRGYKYFTIFEDHSRKNLLVSRVVCYLYGDLPSLDSPLEVDHIDADVSNNFYKNLQALTVSMHLEKTLKERGQTPKEYKKCPNCMDKDILTRSNTCQTCSGTLRRVFNPSKEELHDLVWSMPTTKVAKLFGVSDSAVGKRCKKLGVAKPPRGYWQKRN